MDEAYDAKFGLCSIGPLTLFSRLFIVTSILFTSLFSSDKKLQERDIHLAMEAIFSAHVKHKSLSPKIVRRMLRTYIESFDVDRALLLEKEAKGFFNISDARLKKITKRLELFDFSDFYSLNEIFKSAITRAREIRGEMVADIDNLDSWIEEKGSKSRFAKNERELFLRNRNLLLRFYREHKKSVDVDTLSRKEKLFSLFERRARRVESGYEAEGEEGEHFFVLHFLKAFTRSLDAHSYFFSSEEAKDMRISLEKQFEGIGVVLSETIDGVVIAGLIKKGPAYESGKIEVNDLIVEVNNESVKDLPFEDILERMREREKGKITLGLMRNNNLLRVSLKSRPISISEDRLTFSSEPFGDGIIAKLELRSFYDNPDNFSSEKDIKDALVKLKKVGKLKGIVLDLRENSGGFLSQAVKVAGLFISNGVVVMSKYGEDVKYLRSLNGRSCFKGPLVILTSKMSASAAEIVAQALQDYGVAIVVGDKRTFGKGSVQYQTVTDENADYYYKVTIGKYYTTSGRTTQINGVRADIVVPSIYSPYRVGERYLEYALEADIIDDAYQDPLEDIEPKLRALFKKNYLPYLQEKVNYWQRMLPVLRKNSEYRMKTDLNFKVYLERQRAIKDRLNGIDREIDRAEFGSEDLQMQEAINIIKDMVIIEAKSKNILNERFRIREQAKLGL